MSEEARTNKRRRSESEEPDEEAGDGAGADVVGAGAPAPEVLDSTRPQDNQQTQEADDGADQAAADATATAAPEPPKMPTMPTMTMPVQMTHHQAPARVDEKQSVENYYKTDQQAVDTSDYKVPGVNVMASMGGVGGVSGIGGGISNVGAVGGVPNVGGVAAVGNLGGLGVGGINTGGMTMNASSLSGLAGMGGMATLAGVPGMSLGGVDLNQQLLVAQQRQYEMNLQKAQMNNAAAAAAAAARAVPKPQSAPTGRKSAPSSYEPPVQLTASGRPARARRVNYAELAGALDDDEEDDQSNLVPNWARRRRKNADQDRDYGVGVGGSRGGGGGGVQLGGGGNAAMYGVAGAGNFNVAPRAAAPTAGVNLYGLAGQGAAGLRNAVGGASSAGLQAANLAAGIAGNAALAGQAGWQNQVVWGQTPGMGGPYGALQSLAAAQARPQVAAAQQFLLQPGAGRGVAPNIMQDMQLMLSRGADGQGGMPGAGQQR